MDSKIFTISPEPLGLSFQGDKARFALFSQHAKQVYLSLFWDGGFEEIPMERTGDVWHIELQNIPVGATYTYRCDDKKGLFDPYAKAPLCEIKKPTPFDWEGVESPKIPLQDLIIYEMHVRGFTKDPSSQVKYPGTYLGVIEKIPFLKKLGINAVELMPIFDGPQGNYWGYNPIHFFAPKKAYAHVDPVNEFKQMVKELHRNGIEVILDVVYNHTGEEKADILSFRGIDADVYYLKQDYTGCKNTFNTNHPVVQKLILDSLHFWVEEMHVDGFRFDLTSIFTRDLNGHKVERPPILEKIEKDPMLKNVKLIAEPWDAAGLYQLGSFAKRGPWSEWNDHFRDVTRRFMKGKERAGAFANVFLGSDSVFKNPLSSVNFVTAHDGFTLKDLVSYEKKHNLENGEANLDGTDKNESWNCGIEGETQDPQILAFRERQMRNFLVALLLSQGIPMLIMNDVYGHSCKGNNNPYKLDNELNWFSWKELQKKPKMFNFISHLIAFRKQHPELRKDCFFKDGEIDWQGTDWNSSFLSFVIQEKIFIAFNASPTKKQISLPDGNWSLVVNTAEDWIFHQKKTPLQNLTLNNYSALVAVKENTLLY